MNWVNAAAKKEIFKNLQHPPKPKTFGSQNWKWKLNQQSLLHIFMTQRIAKLIDVLIKDK